MNEKIIKYRAHVGGDGWQEYVNEGEIMGTVGQNKPIEAFQIQMENSPGLGIGCVAKPFGMGWSIDAPQGDEIGTTGMSIPLEKIRLYLFGPESGEFDVWYNVHVSNIGWLGWVRNGEVAGTDGSSGENRIEAIQIRIARKGMAWMGVDDLAGYIDKTPKMVEESIESKRARIIKRAQSFVGYRAEYNGFSIFGSEFGDPYGDYCSYFVSKVFRDEGLANAVPQTGYCPTGFNAFKTWNQYKPAGTYTPQNGDVIYFDWAPYNKVPNHVGIVEGCDGKTVCTIEGNTGSPNGVYKKYWAINDPNIMGYGIPIY